MAKQVSNQNVLNAIKKHIDRIFTYHEKASKSFLEIQKLLKPIKKKAKSK